MKKPSDCQVLPDLQLSETTASAVLLQLCVQISSYVFKEQFLGDLGLWSLIIFLSILVFQGT